MNAIRWLRPIIRLGMLVGAIILIMQFTNCEIPSCSLTTAQGPTGVVERMLHSIESRDPEKVGSYFFGPVADIMRQQMRRLYGRFETVKVENVAVELVYEESINARVHAYWDLVTTAYGQTSTQRVDQLLRLSKVNGEWLIKESL